MAELRYLPLLFNQNFKSNDNALKWVRIKWFRLAKFPKPKNKVARLLHTHTGLSLTAHKMRSEKNKQTNKQNKVMIVITIHLWFIFRKCKEAGFQFDCTFKSFMIKMKLSCE